MCRAVGPGQVAKVLAAATGLLSARPSVGWGWGCLGRAAGKLWVAGGRRQTPGSLRCSERKGTGAAAGVRLPTERAEVGLRRKSWGVQGAASPSA